MNLTNNAQSQISDLVRHGKECFPKKNVFFRVSAQKSISSIDDCYLLVDYDEMDIDLVFKYDDFEVRSDNKSIENLSGYAIDYSADPGKEGFILKNIAEPA
jgi:Fe-S cluster assembly iron-binding protein IscA